MTEANSSSRNNPPRSTDENQPDQTRGEHAADHRGATAAGEDRNRDGHEHHPRSAAVQDHTTRDVFIGTDEHIHGRANVSWGAIFAGVFTFIALMFVFGLVSIGLGLEGAGGMAVGIWSAIALLVALALAGFIAGSLGVRAGFWHGMGTWATSIVAMLVLVGWLGANTLGALGGAVGTVAQGAIQGDAITSEDLGAAAEEAEVDEQELEQTQQQLEETAQQTQDDLAASAWWSVAGLLLGAVVAGLTGAAGARSVHTRNEAANRVVADR